MRNMVISILLFTVGLCIMLYPVVSNYLADQMHVQQVESYKASAEAMPWDQVEKEWAKALDYNNSLIGTPVKDPFVQGTGIALPDNYLAVLNQEGVMGWVEIPKINVDLPIYHGTSDEVLKKGVGHMESTALPIGTYSSHAVLTGHTGLPNARLFDGLTSLEIGDEFFINVLNKELVYEIDQIKVVLPDNTEDLLVEKDKDYVTLITCTPYAINTHRLLVRGHRVSHYSKMVRIAGSNLTVYYIVLGVALFIPAVMGLVYVIKRLKKPRGANI